MLLFESEIVSKFENFMHPSCPYPFVKVLSCRVMVQDWLAVSPSKKISLIPVSPLLPSNCEFKISIFVVILLK